ncbi:PH domain-containing protein [Brevibacillus dissolubilis]|uniref:PH domain-containing protein n=1 Tax=Brevibacillus dissolubilis TaxID=1844116 RepID=UPI00111692B9|nr:PH domain-containing protein [Brevibacillus dissolubilis]
MRFASKKDGWTGAVIWLVIALVTFNAYQEIRQPSDEFVEAVTVAVIVDVLCLWLWFGTYYVITDQELIVRAGPLHRRVPLCTIQMVRHTRIPISAPALSLDRLEVRYQGGVVGCVVVSPDDQQAFIQALRQHNPSIHYA